MFVENTANIFFDQNPAIVTNTTLNTIDADLSLPTHDLGQVSNTIYPNPFGDKFVIQIGEFSSTEDYYLDFYDVFGRKLFSKNLNSNPSQHLLEDLPNGYYILFIKNSSGQILSSHKLMRNN
ncbi:MAG: T9SS type A sorting domain-containing protein [Crocinitomicaceae bacterium]